MPTIGIPWVSFKICWHECISYNRKKEQKIILASQQLLKQNAPAIGEVAQVIGLLVSSLPTVQYGPLFYRSIEIDKNMALRQHKGNYPLFSHDVTRYPYLGVRHYGASRQRNLMQISSHFYSSSHESRNTFRFDHGYFTGKLQWGPG